jgi:hypothetical protein
MSDKNPITSEIFATVILSRFAWKPTDKSDYLQADMFNFN